MKTFDVQDISGTISCVLFPSQTRMWGSNVNESDILALTVKPQEDRGGLKVIIEGVTRLRKGSSRNSTIHLFLPDDYPVDPLKMDIGKSVGDGTVILHWMDQIVKLDTKSTSAAIKKLLAG